MQAGGAGFAFFSNSTRARIDVSPGSRIVSRYFTGARNPLRAAIAGRLRVISLQQDFDRETPLGSFARRLVRQACKRASIRSWPGCERAHLPHISATAWPACAPRRVYLPGISRSRIVISEARSGCACPPARRAERMRTDVSSGSALCDTEMGPSRHARIFPPRRGCAHPKHPANIFFRPERTTFLCFFRSPTGKNTLDWR